MRTLRISVRRLVEFLLRSGNIGSRSDWHNSIEAMQAGSNIHRMLQASAGPSYKAEVSLACSLFFPNNSFDQYAARLDIQEDTVGGQAGFFLRVEGRADGIIDDGTHPLTIDEIKGVTRDVANMDEPIAIHEAQALCYAYLYLRSKRGPTMLSTAFDEQVVVRLTYASMSTGEVRQIEHAHSVASVETWFFRLLASAQRWAAWKIRHDELRQESIASLEFPFGIRAGQRQIMDAVQAAIHEEKHLYVQASTGSGKTIATLYPALKAMGAAEVDHIAFLTAKTMTRRAALECLGLLKQQGISANVLTMTARNKICPLRSKSHDTAVRVRPLASLCNPLECPLARGHYDHVNDALFEAITTHDVLDFTCIEEVAARHHVCPYELQRDAARWSDVIICDYHYAFAPSASLMGIADEPGSAGTVFLVDEAHNLVERMRNMYSAELALIDLKRLERLLRAQHDLANTAKAVRTAISTFPAWKKDLPASANSYGKRGARRPGYQVVRVDDAFSDALAALLTGIDAALEELFPSAGGTQDNMPHPEASAGEAVEIFLALQDMGHTCRALLGALQRSESGYVTFLGVATNGGSKLKVFCVDPSHDLEQRLEEAKAVVFFSGTLLPMDYYRTLLAAQDDDASIYVQSSFNQRNRQILIGADVSARYSSRGPKLYSRIASYLVALTHVRPGNYLAFVPSYAMLDEVAQALEPLTDDKTEVIQQQPGMRENNRDCFVDMFRATHNANKSLIGLCVLGGIFGESIDLPGDALVGVVVVGTGMPGISDEREIIKSNFDAKEGKGFVYAYTYPGMTKVLQAAGRLIRTENDRGVLLLLDDRFLEDELQKAFPQEWSDVQTCTLKTMPGLLRV